MLERFGAGLRIGVSAQALTLVRSSRWRGAAVLAELALDGHAPGAPERLAPALRQLLQGQRGLPLTIVLDDALVRLWQVVPPQGATRLGDVKAAAALRFQSLYGEAPAAWCVTADWDAGAPFFAAALPRTLLALLEAAARDAHCGIVEIAPQFIHAWNRWHRALKPGAWFALAHEGLLTLGAGDGRRLSALRSVPLPAANDLAWLQAQVAREALRLNLAVPQQVQACGQVPPAWTAGAATEGGFGCSRLDQARAGTPSAGALLAQTGLPA